ncbi:MAG: hypothetical protein ACK2UO_04670 [Caldilineaceae bacterium]
MEAAKQYCADANHDGKADTTGADVDYCVRWHMQKQKRDLDKLGEGIAAGVAGAGAGYQSTVAYRQQQAPAYNAAIQSMNHSLQLQQQQLNHNMQMQQLQLQRQMELQRQQMFGPGTYNNPIYVRSR